MFSDTKDRIFLHVISSSGVLLHSFDSVHSYIPFSVYRLMAPATTFAIMFGPQVRSCEEEPIYGHTLLAVPLLLLMLIMMVMLFQQSSPSTLIKCRICSLGITLALSTSSELGPPLAKNQLPFIQPCI